MESRRTGATRTETIELILRPRTLSGFSIGASMLPGTEEMLERRILEDVGRSIEKNWSLLYLVERSKVMAPSNQKNIFVKIC
ncbi:uncharacterized protein PHALS_13616 [Plasmopara halstedii]|uniref:Uncharacterized protein n=1 Tax=Plasmopara halstedii TaxID=4781 RepID=A0A0N7L666_PLAHL|nr:uncharacterized protein PHALS_13616 [Plasmopara halstedii]CEG43419.1 hypothetical protein PHALS_13616 [Plasmopara halstedii]|eukprot:XP_024579788.1 hypothetical protein PHALS_13616 [Plasmopara halstedii]